MSTKIKTPDGWKDVGGSLSAEYIRNLHDPDWSKAENVSAAQVTSSAGWTATKRGMIIGCYLPTNQIGSFNIRAYINGFAVTVACRNNNVDVWGQLNHPLLPGDVVKVDPNVQFNLGLKFVPYKEQ